MRIARPLGRIAAHVSPESSAARCLSEAIADGSRWLRQCALPLWGSRGFDKPVAGGGRRLMVQGRQVSVYAASALAGVFPEGAALASRAAHSMIENYFGRDGAVGSASSSDRSGQVVNPKRDLYAHAFAIFALAWAMRLEQDRSFEAALAGTLAFLTGVWRTTRAEDG
jgi:mannose/cellobiose epimerase-like protein (N-acyl-D-glucosamine 2-epimerase family)